MELRNTHLITLSWKLKMLKWNSASWDNQYYIFSYIRNVEKAENCFFDLNNLELLAHYKEPSGYSYTSWNNFGKLIYLILMQVAHRNHPLREWASKRCYSLVSINIHPHPSSNFRMKLKLSNIFSCFPDFWKRNNSLVHIPGNNKRQRAST